MFKASGFADFSVELRDDVDWKPAIIRDVEFLPDACAFAVEPVNGLLAVGTRQGKILVFGAPSTGKLVHIPRSAPCRFVQIASLVFKLLCVDEDGNLHIWDLGELGPPKLLTSYALREPVQSLTLSPSHSHAFLALKSGKIVAYDTLCLRKSPYEFPNVWRTIERAVVDSLVMSSPAASPFAIDVVVHPRELNLLFLAYPGGIVLYDIGERRPVRHFVLLLPPGVPGGTGYSDKGILEPRCPPVASIAVHASGQLFVVGYMDGCFAFWATEDGERPLCTRTTDEVNVSVPDTDKLDKLMSSQQPMQGQLSREPIYKISWSCFGSMTDPWGKSALTILGGQEGENAKCIAFLPVDAFVIPTPTTPQGQHRIHPEIRASLLKGLQRTDVQYYVTTGVTQDFLLVPRNTPHGGGAFDPFAVVIMSEIEDGSRSLQAQEFPHPSFYKDRSSAAPTASQTATETDSVINSLDATLQSLNVGVEPRLMLLPSSLWVGNCAINDGDLLKIEQDSYLSLTQFDQSLFDSVGKGGVAWVDYSGPDQASDVRWTSQQPHRLLVTHHHDKTVRFQDISPQLLLGSRKEYLKTAFPSPLEHLTIDVGKLLWETCIISHKRPIPADSDIQSVQLTSETSECIVTMKTGHAIVYGFSDHDRRSRTNPEPVDELLNLTHLSAEKNSFQPLLLIDNTWGAVTACGLSEIGFLALAYNSGALLVVNMRDSTVILHHGTDIKRRHSLHISLHKDDVSSHILSLKWFICGSDDDSLRRVRLLASRWNGSTTVFTFIQMNGNWTADESRTKKVEGIDQPLPRASFIFDSGTGYSCGATTHNMRRSLNSAAPMTEASKGGAHFVWLTAGRKGCRCVVNFSGNKVGKVDWGRGKNVECVEVVDRKGSTALIAIMDTREVQIYTIPYLAPLHKFQLTKQPSSVICMDDTGDYVDWVFDEKRLTVSRLTMGTLFAMRRVFDEPVVDFASNRKQSPAMPQPIPLGPATILGSWLNFKKSVSGDQIDALLAGPRRPLEGGAETTSVAVNGQWQAQMQNRASAFAAQASQAGSEMYNNLATALGERGERLGNMDEHFNSISEGAQRMAASAKRMATTQSAKVWFKFGRGAGSS